MAKAVTIKVDIRDSLGRRGARRTRREGLLPAVMYGHKQESISLAVSERDLLNHLNRGVHLFELDMPNNVKETVLIKDIQYDYLGTNPIHVDFSRVDLTEMVDVTVPVILRGTPAGVSEGGTLQQVSGSVAVRCVVTDIPDEIRVRINDLNIGDTLKAGDLELPEGIELAGEADTVIASVTLIEDVEEPAAGEEGEEASAEPEVIGKGKEETEEESSE